MIAKTLDTRLNRILSDSSCKEFILADAKDADLAFGVAAPGQTSDGRLRTLEEFRELIRENVRQGLLDIMLMSPSTNELLTIRERLFDNSTVTPAARANDATDIHVVTASEYPSLPSRPFRTATINQLMYGRVNSHPGERVIGADLGLYSITFNNNLERDLETLKCYRDFRIEAESKNFRHFLEVFNPNACGPECIAPQDLGRYVNDIIVRTLAGVVGKGRPLFLKIAYNGPAAMEQLASYDRSLVVGILGGSAGTTFDAFHQLWEAKKYGARVALYGRMINNSEHQPTFIQHLRYLADGDLDDPAEAVRSYHSALQKLGVMPRRSLEEDLQTGLRGTAYGSATSQDGNKGRQRTDESSRTGSSASDNRIATNLEKWNRVLG